MSAPRARSTKRLSRDRQHRPTGGACIVVVMRDKDGRQTLRLREHKPRIWSRSPESSFENGSSSSSARGALSRVRISATRARCPPDSVAGSRRPIPSSPAAASAVSRRAARSGVPRGSPNPRLPATDRCGNSTSSWNSSPIRRLWVGRPVTSRPSSPTRPVMVKAAGSVPTIAARAVDLPQPDGPMRVSTSPGVTVTSSAIMVFRHV